jgi:hypothetical protein
MMMMMMMMMILHTPSPKEAPLFEGVNLRVKQFLHRFGRVLRVPGDNRHVLVGRFQPYSLAAFTLQVMYMVLISVGG